tara:strand:- start:66153 stop:67322 length:1170 start_codon:yes stop_codon:yes gene_type:complete
MQTTLIPILFFFSIFFMFACIPFESENQSKEFIYVGTFQGEDSEGLYVFVFDRITGQMTHIQTVTDRMGPNFQALHPNERFLYSVSNDHFAEDKPFGTLSAYKIDRGTGRLKLLNEQSVNGRGVAHVSVDPAGEYVYVSNYSEGNVVMYTLNKDGTVNEAVDIKQHEGSSIREDRQQSAHVHSVYPSADGKYIYVSDLGTDQIRIYRIDRENDLMEPADPPYFSNEPGSGPRHFTIHPNGLFAYSVEELSLTVSALNVDIDSGELTQFQRLSLLPDGIVPEQSMSAADIHISPDGRFLYASVRGENLISIFDIDLSTGVLNPISHESTIGSHPRNFMIDQEGEFLLVANRDHDHVLTFRRDFGKGLLSFTGFEANVPLAVCVTQLIVEK